MADNTSLKHMGQQANNTTSSHQNVTFDHFAGTILLYKILFVIFDGIGIVGNLLVIITIIANKTMRSSIYILVGNLAFVDLLFTLLAPFHITMLVQNYHWPFGAFFCTAYYFVFRTIYTVSMICLVLITAERFLAVRHPLRFHPSTTRTLLCVLASWVLSFLISSPFLSVMKHASNRQMNICFQKWPDDERKMMYYILVYIALYFLPFAVMTYSYQRIFVALRRQPIGGLNDTQTRQHHARKQISFVVTMIVAVFFICWSPWNTIEFLEHISRQGVLPRTPAMPTIKLYAMLGTFLSAAINPILFSFMSSEFREGIRFLLRGRFCQCHRPRIASLTTTTTP